LRSHTAEHYLCTDRDSIELNSSELNVVVGWVLGLSWFTWWLRYCLVGLCLGAWGILSFLWGKNNTKC